MPADQLCGDPLSRSIKTHSPIQPHLQKPLPIAACSDFPQPSIRPGIGLSCCLPGSSLHLLPCPALALRLPRPKRQLANNSRPTVANPSSHPHHRLRITTVAFRKQATSICAKLISRCTHSRPSDYTAHFPDILRSFSPAAPPSSRLAPCRSLSQHITLNLASSHILIPSSRHHNPLAQRAILYSNPQSIL